ncbi:MAG: hypothetical protein ACM3JP_00730 [Betaproteobacteria bacterium]
MLVDGRTLADELSHLRKGAAMRHPRLLTRLGPQTRHVFGISTGDNVATARHKVERRVRAVLTNQPDDLRTAVLVALALSSEAHHARLIDRQRWLATRNYYDVRTARRRIDAAFAYLVDALVEADQQATRSHPGDDGWTVQRFSATLRLDAGGPQLREQRKVLVTADVLDAIICKLSVPSPGTGCPPAEVAARAESGGTITQTTRVSASHFEFRLSLPHPLRRGDIHEYTVVFSLPEGHLMRPHYLYNPLLPCDEFEVTVQFDPHARPTRLWRLGGVPMRMVDDDCGGDELELPDDGRLQLTFREPRPGFAYGVKWEPLQP